MGLENIVTIEEFKRRRASAQETNVLARYYQGLDFHALIQETHNLIKELDQGNLNMNLLDRSTFLLKEYENRCQTKSPQMVEALYQMRSVIEIRVKGLGL
jgi:hypothetical protein